VPGDEILGKGHADIGVAIKQHVLAVVHILGHDHAAADEVAVDRGHIPDIHFVGVVVDGYTQLTHTLAHGGVGHDAVFKDLGDADVGDVGQVFFAAEGEDDRGAVVFEADIFAGAVAEDQTIGGGVLLAADKSDAICVAENTKRICSS
jgi:hypothetical protein